MKSHSKMLTDSVPGENSVPGLQITTFLLCVHMGTQIQREPSFPLPLLRRPSAPLDQSPTLRASFNLNLLLKILSTNTVPLGVGASTYALQEDPLQFVESTMTTYSTIPFGSSLFLEYFIQQLLPE